MSVACHQQLLQRSIDLVIPTASDGVPNGLDVEVKRLPHVGAGLEQRASDCHDLMDIHLRGVTTMV